MFASVKRVTDVTKPMVNQQGPPSASNMQKLELAKRLASRINMAKNLGAEAQDITQQAAAAIFKGSMPAPSVSVSTPVVHCNVCGVFVHLHNHVIVEKLSCHMVKVVQQFRIG